jgi:hypothetical protein
MSCGSSRELTPKFSARPFIKSTMSGKVLSIAHTDFDPTSAGLMLAQSFSIPTNAED